MRTSMTLVILETPYAGDVKTNTRYARACMRDCLQRGEAPLASHLLYTQPGVLNDLIPEEHMLGITAGLEWGSKAEKTVVYTDMGTSKGVLYGIALAHKAGRPVELRTLPNWELTPKPVKCWKRYWYAMRTKFSWIRALWRTLAMKCKRHAGGF